LEARAVTEMLRLRLFPAVKDGRVEHAKHLMKQEGVSVNDWAVKDSSLLKSRHPARIVDDVRVAARAMAEEQGLKSMVRALDGHVEGLLQLTETPTQEQTESVWTARQLRWLGNKRSLDV
jgi:hypothetical protein